MTEHHKVGQMHRYGKIVADALKWDNSGNTVALYEESDNNGYNVVEWDKSGTYEISVEPFDNDENAVISYLYLTFGLVL